MHFLNESTYAALIADLSCAFTSAAHGTSHTFSDLLAEALANAGVMPEGCQEDEAEVALFAA